MTIVTGHLIIVDGDGVEHDFGTAREVEFKNNEVVGHWYIKVPKSIEGAHHFIRGVTETICNRPLNTNLKRGQYLEVTATYGAGDSR